MPGVGQYGGLAFGTVAGEEVEGFVVGIGVAHGHDDLARPDVEASLCEGFVHPELFQGHLTAFFRFCLVFSRLFGLYLYGRLVAAVFELNLRAHGPSVAEVVAHAEGHVRQVKASVALVVLVTLGGVVAVETLAVEVAGHDSLAVASEVEATYLIINYARVAEGICIPPRGSRDAIHLCRHVQGGHPCQYRTDNSF